MDIDSKKVLLEPRRVSRANRRRPYRSAQEFIESLLFQANWVRSVPSIFYHPAPSCPPSPLTDRNEPQRTAKNSQTKRTRARIIT